MVMPRAAAALPCEMPISPDDPIHALRRQLAAEIVRSLGPDAQHVISRSYGIPQPRMSELNRGVVDRCSMEWLIRRIYNLGGQVTVTVTLGDARREWSRQRFAAARVARALREAESGADNRAKTPLVDASVSRRR